MPNHVINQIVINAPEEKIKEILNTITGEENGTPVLDFNKIIPMPNELNIVSGGLQDRAISAYLSYLRLTGISDKEMEDIISTLKRTSHFFIKPDTTLSENDIEREANEILSCGIEFYLRDSLAIKADKDDSPKDILLRFGERYVQNAINYGCCTWYEWCSKNWGTKWNAYDNYISDNVISFNTAWNHPLPVIKKISEMYPDVEISVSYADEDIGYNCGAYTIVNGVLTESDIEDPDQFARKLWCE